MRKIFIVFLISLSVLISGCNFPGLLPAPETPPGASIPSPQPPDSLLPTVTPIEPEHPPLEPTPITEIDATFTLQDGGPFYLPNFTHPDQGCQWMGVAGQVFDEDGLEVLNLTMIAGKEGKVLTSGQEVTTGQSTAYGLGGYEIKLSNKPVDSSGAYWVQVLDQRDNPLSDRVFFDTYDNCEQNLILVNFVPLEE